ncbi:unnamed protein product [Ectocarpus sp. 6 AP-2014]
MKWVGLRPSQLDDLDLPDEASRKNKKRIFKVHQTLSQQDLARAQSVANSTLVTDNPDTYGEEVEYWLDTENPGKG